jgi:hypothetical protein
VSVCLPDLFNLKFTNVGGCCLQWNTVTDIDLDLVYRSQTYWNSTLVLPWFGCTTQWWFYLQFHLICQHVGGQQTFILRWLDDVPSRQCEAAAMGPPFELKAWTLVEQVCDPFYLKFECNNAQLSSCQAADDCEGPAPICDFIAEITEKAP